MSADIAASVKARLLNATRERAEEFERTLLRFANERVLYRLGQSAARDRCILKGAGLLTIWLADPYRSTRDIDLLALGPDNDAAIRELIETIAAIPCPEDGLRLDLASLAIEDIRPDEAYAGKRARFLVYLGSARIRMQIDFGHGDALTTDPEEVDYPTILGDLPAPRVRVYPRAASIAEKFEAMVKLETRNSRMKDFHDVWELSGRFIFDGPGLRDAVAACFERRQTPWPQEVPGVLTPSFYQRVELQDRWNAYLRSSAMRTRPAAPFEEVGERIRRFLLPVRDAIVHDSPFGARWAPGGPWQ